MSNPLTRKRKTNYDDKENGPTPKDIDQRLRGAMHPGETILSKSRRPDYNTQTINKIPRFKSSAPVHLNIASDDTISTEINDTKIPYESLAFEPLNSDPLQHFTLIESKIYSGLKTGKFLKMMKKNLTFEDNKQEFTPLPQEEKEKNVYLQLQSWAKRLHKLFLVLQGLLAGVALLHIYLLYFSTSNETFVKTYGQLARVIGVMFHILIFFALIGAILRSINERKHCKK